MKNIKITLVAIAIGFLSSTSAIGENLSQHDPIDGPIGIESQYRSAVAPILIADAGVLAAVPTVDAGSPAASSAYKFSAARLDAIYEAAKKHCDSYAAGAQVQCLAQMKTSFGRL
jgi:hypothetical protein